MGIEICVLIAAATFCGQAPRAQPQFPELYLAPGDKTHRNFSRTPLLSMPVPDLEFEVNRFVKSNGERDGTPCIYPEIEVTRVGESTWDVFVDIDTADLRAAVAQRGDVEVQVAPMVFQYQALRTAMRPPRRNAPKDSSQQGPAFPEIETALRGLPREFELYVRGAAAYHTGKPLEAVRNWQELLALPEDQRSYRTVWAEFMLGRALLDSDPSASRLHFERARELTASGWRDSLGLKNSSFEWLAKSEAALHDPVAAMHHYAEWYMALPHEFRRPALDGLANVAREAAKHSDLRLKLAQDAFCREVTTTAMFSTGRYAAPQDPFSSWCDACVAVQQTKIVDGADKLAWGAYSRRTFDAARLYMDLSNPSLPYSRWVRAKLLIQSGESNDALQILYGLQNAMPQSELWNRQYSGSGQFTNCRSNIHADIATLLLNRGAPTSALEEFLKAGRWLEAAYVAERVLTLDELGQRMSMPLDLNSPVPLATGYDEEWTQEYMQRVLDESVDHAKTLTPGYRRPGTFYDLLRYLYARRLARAGEWKKAIPNFPPHVRPIAEEIAGHLSVKRTAEMKRGIMVTAARRVRNLWKGYDVKVRVRTIDREWAKHQFQAAKLIREHGMELLGTEVDPDWHFFHGDFEHVAVAGMRGRPLNRVQLPYDEDLVGMPVGMPWSTASEQERVQASAPKPDVRYHYRYTAANLFWQSAAHLPNNDIDTVRALYYGGMCVKDCDPEYADKFYKALVWRNPNVRYVQDTDKHRWFLKTPPPEATP